MSETHDEKETERYIPTESAIKQLFHGNAQCFDEAAKFLAELFNSEIALEEGTWFESEEDFLKNGYPDLIDLVDVDGGEDDRFRIAWLAIDGTDIDDDSDEEKDLLVDTMFKMKRQISRIKSKLKQLVLLFRF